ncbi:hypothetical protein [Flavobacterium sp. PL002]|uniref:hypothetical protein n=1 Tax=Flavobacterium sp. PL002 TaxID=1897058 RepID=UPI0017879941|nr:hypothetical protein [Flavobacterium sp. PL002]MBE0393381.1 hypothetical protein [Flavobacterium sp. PL002]
MKKLLFFFVTALLISCSQDQVDSAAQSSDPSSSVLEGKLLSFKDDKSFINEYSQLSELKSGEERISWISKKGHVGFLNSNSDILEDVLDENRIIYSDALKAIVNVESKVKIGGKVLWLHGLNLYELKTEDENKTTSELLILEKNLSIYGSVFNANKLKDVPKITSRLTIPNINGRSFTYSKSANDKNYYMVVYNETIALNGNSTSKMYLKAYMTYRSCSFWRCTNKDDNTTGRYLYFNVNFVQPWVSVVSSGYTYAGSGVQTILLANLMSGPFQSNDFNMDGNVRMMVSNGFDWTQTF